MYKRILMLCTLLAAQGLYSIPAGGQELHPAIKTLRETRAQEDMKRQEKRQIEDDALTEQRRVESQARLISKLAADHTLYAQFKTEYYDAYGELKNKRRPEPIENKQAHEKEKIKLSQMFDEQEQKINDAKKKQDAEIQAKRNQQDAEIKATRDQLDAHIDSIGVETYAARQQEDADRQAERGKADTDLQEQRAKEDSGFFSKFDFLKQRRRNKQDAEIQAKRKKEDKQREEKRASEHRTVQKQRLYEIFKSYPKDGNHALMNRLADLMSEDFYGKSSKMKFELLESIKKQVTEQESKPSAVNLGISNEHQIEIFKILMPGLTVTPQDTAILNNEASKVSQPALKQLNDQIKKWAAQEAQSLITQLQQRNDEITKDNPITDGLSIAASSCIIISYVGIFTSSVGGIFVAAAGLASAVGFWALAAISEIAQYAYRSYKGVYQERDRNKETIKNLSTLFPTTMTTINRKSSLRDAGSDLLSLSRVLK